MATPSFSDGGPRSSRDMLGSLPTELQEFVFEDCLRHDACIITERKLRSALFASPHDFSFSSKNTLAFPSKPARQVYTRMLGTYILDEAPVITIKIRDLNFSNARKLIAQLKKSGRYSQFEPDAGGTAPRVLRFYHIVSKDFPDAPDKLFKFIKYAKSDATNVELHTEHYVKHCEDYGIVARFLERLAGSEDEWTSGHLKTLLDAFRRYASVYHYAIQHENYREELRRWQETDARNAAYLGRGYQDLINGVDPAPNSPPVDNGATAGAEETDDLIRSEDDIEVDEEGQEAQWAMTSGDKPEKQGTEEEGFNEMQEDSDGESYISDHDAYIAKITGQEMDFEVSLMAGASERKY